MLGRNKPRGYEGKHPDRIQIHEIFYTIQGEGPFTGHPAVFARLTGCNLRCWFCDTTWDDEGDKYMSPEAIYDAAIEAGAGRTRLLVLTGGEPLRQNLSRLIDKFSQHNWIIQIETAGSFWQPCLINEGIHLVVSPKVAKVHPKIRDHAQHWKYIIGPNEEWPPKWKTQKDDKGGLPCLPPARATVWLQPMDDYRFIRPSKVGTNIKRTRDLALANGFNISLQTHKILGVP